MESNVWYAFYAVLARYALEQPALTALTAPPALPALPAPEGLGVPPGTVAIGGDPGLQPTTPD